MAVLGETAAAEAAAADVVSRVLELSGTMEEGLLFARERALLGDGFWLACMLCDVSDALASIERAVSRLQLAAVPEKWQAWSDWLGDSLERAAAACLAGDWEKAAAALEEDLFPCFEGWRRETERVLKPSVVA